MEIGGYDTIIKNPENDLSQKIINFVGWDKGVFEQDEGKDFFFYKQQSDKDAWDQDGSIAETENTMIYFIFQDDCLTLVTDKELTNKIQNFLNDIGVNYEN